MGNLDLIRILDTIHHFCLISDEANTISCRRSWWDSGGCVSRFRLEPNSTSSSSSSREKKKSSKNERLPTVNWVGWKWKGDCVYGRLLAQSAPRDNPIPTPRILFMIIHLFSPSSLCAPAIPHLWRRGSGPTSLLNPTLYSTIFFPFSLFFSWV